MKRLYIGGLSHTISRKDIRDRFGKFGEVCDVEIITRNDENGSPLKTFGYVNINLSDSDYKRCVTVLNKSKWKGGTLQIELAKESFLHRLEAERQQASEKIQTQKIGATEKIMESLNAAGVENFHMKAAVPGTEIPGHKNWVVSKFGRVLPVVHLKCEGKNKVFKYDPSKHCHNIKKLEAEESFTPVSKLTWQIEGGDDEISKKRRGEFPAQKKRPTTSKSLDSSSILYSTPETWAAGQNRDAGLQVLPAHKPPVCVFDSDCDSETELRLLVAQELSRNHKSNAGEDEENIEVVGDDFVVKSSIVWGGEETGFNAPPQHLNDEEYDSADTDEILTQNKTSGKAGDLMETDTCSSESPVKSKMTKGKKAAIKNSQIRNESDSENDSESSNHSIDSDYEAMIGNCQRLELSLGDLKNLVKNLEEEVSDDEDAKNGPNGTTQTSSELQTGPSRTLSKKSCINPEDILAALFGPAEDTEEQKKSKIVKKSCLPAFVGTKDLFTLHTGLKRTAEKVSCEFGVEPKRLKSDSKAKQTEDSVQAPGLLLNKLHNDLGDVQPSEPKNLTASSKAKHLPSSSHSEEEKQPIVPLKNKIMKTHRRSAPDSSGSTEESEMSSDEEEKTDTDLKWINDTSGSGPRPFQQSVSDPAKQQQDNQKRLAAVEKRQFEAEQQRKLIQGALSKVDLPNANKGKHIVFDSDDEVNNDSENTRLQKVNIFAEDSDEDDGSGSVKVLDKKNLEKTEGSRLFDSDEDDGSEEDRFKIKPQFEGRAGQKLMALQSRFGTDPRFQMDSKFLDSDDDDDGGNEQCSGDVEPQQTPEEQDLIEEKKKNLSILQSVLNVNIEPSDTSKGATKGKIFKDISALHYDPSSETHAAFETKTETPKKESKAARRKKREEAIKLPEVSKDIYYDVTTDLKEIFGMGKEIQNETKAVSWDQDNDDDEEEEEEDGGNKENDMHSFSFLSNPETEPSGGFKFSFFENDAITKIPTTDEYKAEPIKGPKVPWQLDPRFQDSSSEEEEEKNVEDEAAPIVTTEQTAPKKKFFFFFDDDIRLKEGPSLFCRQEKLEDQREAWEERRQDLREEYRKKHKDAKRRFKIGTKS